MYTRKEIRQMAGDVIQCGFEGQSVGPELKEIVREIKPLGLILFARNLDDPYQVIELNHELKALRPEQPLLLSIDQEGGRVERLKKGVTRYPPMRRLGEIYQTDAKLGSRLTYEVGVALARELRCLGFDLNFSPVLDVNTNPSNPVIGDRSFGASAEVVAALGAAMIDGLQSQGVAACGKHFPGHGDTSVDSHLGLPTVHHDLKRLKELEWIPFQRAIKHQVAGIMSAHVVIEALDKQPATVSPILMGEWLRRTLGFTGVIFSDDVDMKGLANEVACTDIGPRGLQAGIDCFLACRNPETMLELYRGIIVAVELNLLHKQTLAEASQRCQSLRSDYCRPIQAAPQARLALEGWVELHRSLVSALLDK